MAVRAGGCTAASGERPPAPPLGLGFPWATGAILGSNREEGEMRGRLGDGWGGVRGRHSRGAWPTGEQGGRQESRTGPQRLTEWRGEAPCQNGRASAKAPPLPSLLGPEWPSEVVQGSGVEPSCPRNLPESGKCIPASRQESNQDRCGYYAPPGQGRERRGNE